MILIRDRRTLAISFVALLCVTYLIDSMTEVSVLKDTSFPIGMERLRPKKTYDKFVKQAASIDPAYPSGIPMISLPEATHNLPKYLKYKETILTPVINLEVCAPCWTISVRHVFSDRSPLLTGGNFIRPLSFQEMPSCFNPKGNNVGCEVGGSPDPHFDTRWKRVLRSMPSIPMSSGRRPRSLHVMPGNNKVSGLSFREGLSSLSARILLATRREAPNT